MGDEKKQGDYNCTKFVGHYYDAVLTDAFCSQCPKYLKCSGSLDLTSLRRLVLEDAHKLEKFAV